MAAKKTGLGGEMRDGWIKLHRKIGETAFWNTLNSDQRIVAISLLLMANYEQSNWVWGGKKYICEPGEFITSRAKIAGFALVSESSVRSAISRLRRIGPFLTSKSTKESTKIRILNWDKYQLDIGGGPKTKPTIQPIDQPRVNQEPTTIKKYKNNKEKGAPREKLITINDKEQNIIMDDWCPIPDFFYDDPNDSYPQEFYDWANKKWDATEEEVARWYRQFLDWHGKNRKIKKGHHKNWWQRWQDWARIKAGDRNKERPLVAPPGDWDPYATKAFSPDSPLPPGVKNIEDMTLAEMKEKGITK